MSNIAENILQPGQTFPQSIFMECEGVKISRAMFSQMVAARQSQLTKTGCGKGQHAILVTGRGNQVWVDLVALWASGLVAILIEAEATPGSVEVIWAKVQPQIILGSFNNEKINTEDLLKIPPLPQVDIKIEEQLNIEDLEPSALALIAFTSGSTGEPKGVELTHQALTINTQGTIEIVSYRPDNRLFMAIPFRFLSAVCHFLAVSFTGATLIGTERLHFQGDYIQAILTNKATATGGSPLQARWISEAAQKKSLGLRWIMSTGDHLAKEVIEDLLEYTPETLIYVGYGLTELAGRFCIMPADQLHLHIGSVGKPIEGLNVKVLDGNNKTASSGTIGHIYAQGDCLFSGYHNDEQTTMDILTPVGLKTGDMGYLDSDGWLFITGRSDDVFKRAGLKVSTIPVADALMKSGKFEDVAVVPVRDPLMGHVPHVYYKLRSGVFFNKSSVLTHLRKVLPPNYMPNGFTELSEIPRTGSGKIDRKRLAGKFTNV